MVEKAIYDILKNDAGLIALQADRVYPVIAPINTSRPYMVFQRMPNQERQDAQVGIAPLCIGQFGITIVADSYFSAKTVAEELRLSFSRVNGVYATVTIQNVEFSDEFDGLEQKVEGSEQYFFTVTTIWTIAFVESTS